VTSRRGAGASPAVPPATGRHRRGGGGTAGGGAGPPYRADLAYIHHAGFSEFAESAAPFVIELLRTHGAQRVVEVGCGSGVLARELTRAGFDVRGYDASPAMIELARETAPEARFAVATFAEADTSECDAVVAMGEVLNYGSFDEVRAFIANLSARLLLFDIAEEDAPYEERRVEGDDWSVILIRERNTRRVLTFRAMDGAMRRDEEVHALHLHDRAAMTALLREHGFRVRVRRTYGTRRVPKGHAVYLCVRPGRTAGSPTRRAK
jgi:SAM-dependent methyltransferase